MDASAVADLLRTAVPDAAIEPLESGDMPVVGVGREHLVEVATVLRDHPSLQFAFLADVTAVDRLPADPRFEVVYNLACLGDAFMTAGATQPAAPARLRLKTHAPESDARVPSLVGVWPAAGWLEREVFDLFGIAFDSHPDLRRLLMPDDWEGHPLRKDYAVQIRKDAAAWSPLQLTVEEFARNVRAGHDQAEREARPVRRDTNDRE
jgi:NADH-quinone oxidoreductase subunit C